MTDTMTAKQRSHVMSRIRSKDTKPELAARKIVRKLGYGFCANDRSLPGTPDIVIRPNVCIEVNGCFWHRHRSRRCPVSVRKMPSSNPLFWKRKLLNNVKRDRRKADKLRRLGWRVLTIWECELRNPDKVMAKIKRFVEK